MKVFRIGPFLALVGWLALVVPARAEGIALRLLPQQERGTVRTLKARVRVTGRTGQEKEFVVTVPGVLEIPAAAGGWFPLRLTLTGPGLWAAPIRLEGPRKGLEWNVWKTAPVTLRFQLPAGKRPFPARVKVSFRGCPDRQGRCAGPAGIVEVPVKDGAATVELPRACLDLEVLSRRFAPISVPGVPLAEGKPRTVAGLVLRPGSSISGTVVSALDGLGLEAVTVRLREFRQGTPGRVLRRKRTDVRGHFRFAGLAPGQYLVEVFRKDAVVARVRAETTRGAETTLEALEVGPPATLVAAVEPPDCLGKSWKVCVWPAGEPTPLACADTVASGEAELEGLSAGEYTVTLEATCSSRPETVESQHLTLGWGDRASIAFSPALCLVSGTVTVGDEPLPSDLAFEPGTAGRSVVHARSDEHGRYRVLLPATGRYTVRVNGEGVSWHGWKALEKCPVTLDLELPDTALRGRVVTETEEPAPGATVTAIRSGTGEPERARATADGEGRFVFRGIQAGSWRLRAERGRESSAWVVRNISDGGLPPADTTLVLHSDRRVGVHVVDSDGVPVHGARLMASWACSSATGQPLDGGEMELTNEAGLVELTLPEACRSLQVLVAGEGGPLAVTRLAVASDLTVTLPAGGGRFRFTGEPRYWSSYAGPYLALIHNGAVVVAQQLVQWTTFLHQSPGDLARELVTPVLEPGGYGLVLVPDGSALRRAVMQPDAFRPLATLEVTPGATEDVDLAAIPGLGGDHSGSSSRTKAKG